MSALSQRKRVKRERELDNISEKFDVPKPVMTDKSPDDDDLFSDCRSEFGSEADRSCSNISNLNKSTIRRQSYDQVGTLYLDIFLRIFFSYKCYC